MVRLVCLINSSLVWDDCPYTRLLFDMNHPFSSFESLSGRSQRMKVSMWKEYVFWYIGPRSPGASKVDTGMHNFCACMQFESQTHTLFKLYSQNVLFLLQLMKMLSGITIWVRVKWIPVFTSMAGALIKQERMSPMKILNLCVVVAHSLVYGSRLPEEVSEIPTMFPSSDFAFGWLM